MLLIDLIHIGILLLGLDVAAIAFIEVSGTD